MGRCLHGDMGKPPAHQDSIRPSPGGPFAVVPSLLGGTDNWRVEWSNSPVIRQLHDLMLPRSPGPELVKTWPLGYAARILNSPVGRWADGHLVPGTHNP